jgi:hypothetical protein
VLIEQTGAAARTRFEFGDVMLSYTLHAGGASRTVETDYAFLPRRRGLAATSAVILRTLGHLGFAVGVAMVAMAFATKVSPFAGFVVIGVSALCLLVHMASLTPMTVLRTNDGEIWVIRGREHNPILRELERRRRLRLRELFHAGRPRALLAAPADEADER